MKNCPPIPSIAGVPDELIQAINARFRLVPDPYKPPAVTNPVGGLLGDGQNLTGTHDERLGTAAGALPIGSLFGESDRGALYQVRQVDGAPQWVWAGGGAMRDTLANIPAGLGALDVGFLYEATDFGRVFRWTGAAWERAPGERPTREFCYFAEDPGTGWKICDGSAGVTYTKADASTATMTMPNETAGAYRKSGAVYSGATNAASLPAVTGSTASVSAGTPAGTVSQPTFTGNALAAHQHDAPMAAGATTFVWMNAPFGTGSSQTAMSYVLRAGAETGSWACMKVSAVSAGTPSGTVSQPTFAGSALATHNHGAGTLALASGAEPANIVMLPYMKL